MFDIYVDCRKLLGSPQEFQESIEFIAIIVSAFMGFFNFLRLSSIFPQQILSHWKFFTNRKYLQAVSLTEIHKFIDHVLLARVFGYFFYWITSKCVNKFSHRVATLNLSLVFSRDENLGLIKLRSRLVWTVLWELSCDIVMRSEKFPQHGKTLSLDNKVFSLIFHEV